MCIEIAILHCIKAHGMPNGTGPLNSPIIMLAELSGSKIL